MSERRELSLRLNDVLEMVGVTEEMRSLHRRRARMAEILQMIYMKRHFGHLCPMYRCGSSWEGTVTPDLASDMDMIGCPGKPLVVPHHLMAGPGEFLHVVRDEWTRPGFVKLQLMSDGRPLTVNDVEACEFVGFGGEGRACYKHVTHGTMHGPASMDVNEDGWHYGDRVHAYQCKGIPLFATDWITRQRRFEWPSQQLIDELKMMGCLYVGVGHFESRDKELEWRLSFSVQERMLVKNLNITQHRVYVILKMVRKSILEQSIKKESLSSYHCKTCVFYMAETTPACMWVPENIIDCVVQCLTLLLRWVKDRFCPSFFLKDSNLFDKEGFLRLADQLERLLATLVQMDHKFLYLLQSDHVGEMLRGEQLLLFKPVTESRIDEYISNSSIMTINCVISSVRRVSGHDNRDQDLLSLYMTQLQELKHGEDFPSRTEAEYRYVLRLALPWLHLSIGLEFAARAATCHVRHEGNVLMKKVDFHLQQARNTDLVNVKLAQATILLRLEKLDECFKLLQELESCWAYHVSTCCPSTARAVTVVQDEEQMCEIVAEYRSKSLKKIMRKRVASCVIFERSQIELVPSPLRYEMYRSLYTRPGFRDEREYDCFDLAEVDANVYFYLLQYIVCSKLNREPHKRIAIGNLATITLHDEYKDLNHRETAFNLLGWVHLQEHRVADALWCFLQSWQIRPHHNAAKFHVLAESFEQARASGSSTE